MFQQQDLEYDIPVTTPSQDTNEHSTSDNPYQQPLYDDSGGHTILLGQLEMETQAIVSFTAELSGDRYHQQINHPPDDCPTPPIPPLVCNYSSCHVTKLLYFTRLLPLILYKNHLMVRVI